MTPNKLLALLMMAPILVPAVAFVAFGIFTILTKTRAEASPFESFVGQVTAAVLVAVAIIGAVLGLMWWVGKAWDLWER